MSPGALLKQRIHEHAIRAKLEILACERLLLPEIQPGMSTYKLDHDTACKMHHEVKEAMNCLKKLLAHI